MKKIAIVCAAGMGDGLLFYGVAQKLRESGWEATLYSDPMLGFGGWVSQDLIARQPLTSYEAILLQHDNNLKSKEIEKLPTTVYRFFGAFSPEKHGKWREPFDYACDRGKTMVQNVRLAIKKFFDLEPKASLTPPPGLIHRRFPRRIAIHPTASSPQKMWPRKKFLKLATLLENRGFEPHFITSPAERGEFPGAADLPTLGDLAAFLYESGGMIGNDSGPAHLASLLQIPHLVIGGDGLQMPLWRTGWHPGELICPPRALMRVKVFRKRWNLFINPHLVLNRFIKCY